VRRKKRDKERWRRLAALGAKQEVPTPEGETKMSAVILELAKPMLDSHGTTEERIRVIVLHTIISWNASMLPQDERSTVDKVINAFLPRDATAEDVGAIIDSMEQVSERRQQLYPHLRKLIVDHEVRITRGSLVLNVSTAPMSNSV
jgi:K+/H+ antiporter YhaU regulatory subunit KhtT